MDKSGTMTYLFWKDKYFPTPIRIRCGYLADMVRLHRPHTIDRVA